MTPGILDHLLTLILAIPLPIFIAVDARRYKAKLEAGDATVRANGYRVTIAILWVLATATLAIWLGAERGLADLGLGFDATLGWWIGAAVTALLIAGSAYHTLRSTGTPEALAKTRKELEAQTFLPHTPQEARLFDVLSVTAGVFEEVIYRGFLIAYFSVYADVWLAILLSSIVFGLGHVYQGAVGIAKTGAVGLTFAVLYVLTGSLWVPMVLHIFMDLNAGFVGRRLMATEHPA